MTTREEHDRYVATGMHECASDCPLPEMTDRPTTEPRCDHDWHHQSIEGTWLCHCTICGIVPNRTEAAQGATKPNYYDPGNFDGPSYNAGFTDGEMKGRAEAAQGGAPRAEGLICAACGQTEPPVVEVPLHPRCAEETAPRAEGLEEGQAILDHLLDGPHRTECYHSGWEHRIDQYRLAAPRAEGLDVLAEVRTICDEWGHTDDWNVHSIYVKTLLERLAARLSRPSDERDTENPR